MEPGDDEGFHRSPEMEAGAGDGKINTESKSKITFQVCCCGGTPVVSNSVRPHGRSPPGPAIPGILQARTLEGVAISGLIPSKNHRTINNWPWRKCQG